MTPQEIEEMRRRHIFWRLLTEEERARCEDLNEYSELYMFRRPEVNQILGLHDYSEAEWAAIQRLMSVEESGEASSEEFPPPQGPSALDFPPRRPVPGPVAGPYAYSSMPGAPHPLNFPRRPLPHGSYTADYALYMHPLAAAAQHGGLGNALIANNLAIPAFPDYMRAPFPPTDINRIDRATPVSNLDTGSQDTASPTPRRPRKSSVARGLEAAVASSSADLLTPKQTRKVQVTEKPAYVSIFGPRQNKLRQNITTQVDDSTTHESVVTTPERVHIKDAKISLSAPATVNMDPDTPRSVLQSRQKRTIQQSMRSLNIDPTRSPPPPFWPSGMDPSRAERPHSSNSGDDISPKSFTTQVPHYSQSEDGAQSDPFLTQSCRNAIGSQTSNVNIGRSNSTDSQIGSMNTNLAPALGDLTSPKYFTPVQGRTARSYSGPTTFGHYTPAQGPLSNIDDNDQSTIKQQAKSSTFSEFETARPSGLAPSGSQMHSTSIDPHSGNQMHTTAKNIPSGGHMYPATMNAPSGGQMHAPSGAYRPAPIPSGHQPLQTQSRGPPPRATPQKDMKNSPYVQRLLDQARQEELAQRSTSTEVGFPVNPNNGFDLSFVPTGCESALLKTLCPNGSVPPLVKAFSPQFFPFVASCNTYSNAGSTGVIRIKNIPYHTSVQEIYAYLGRNARLLPEREEPITIIMERVQAKTQDAYIEFVNVEEAVNAMNRFTRNRENGHAGRIGNRHIDMELVGHAALMKDLFPRAKMCEWFGAQPQIYKQDARVAGTSCFQGFVTPEELFNLVRHVETPDRSPFQKECPQRPWECLVATIRKYPWDMIDNITLGERDRLADAALKMVRILVSRIKAEPNHTQVNQRLLKRVQHAVFECPGLNLVQKDNIAFETEADSLYWGLVPNPDHWCVFRTLGPKRNWPVDVIGYYIYLLREATTSPHLNTLADLSAAPPQMPNPSMFGNVHIRYPKNFRDLTIRQINDIKWAYLDTLLKRVLIAAGANPDYSALVGIVDIDH